MHRIDQKELLKFARIEHLIREFPSLFQLEIPSRTFERILTISQPANGSQKLIEIEDERKLRVFMDKRYEFILGYRKSSS
jgi:hypothetical protein